MVMIVLSKNYLNPCIKYDSLALQEAKLKAPTEKSTSLSTNVHLLVNATVLSANDS